MAYSDFTLDRLTQDFGVSFQGDILFENITPIKPGVGLMDVLDVATRIGVSSEKSRSERLVSPVLVELVRLNHFAFTVVSGANLDAEPARGLNGECDFVLTFSRVQDFIQTPVFCVTEAKKQDLEQGTLQCAAQLIGAARLNERTGKPIPTLYGCSTTGLEWRFLRFENQTFTLDESRYLIKDVNLLLGVLQHIVDQARQ